MFSKHNFDDSKHNSHVSKQKCDDSKHKSDVSKHNSDRMHLNLFERLRDLEGFTFGPQLWTCEHS